MRQCATDQGYGEAAGVLGINLQEQANYQMAVKIFQSGVRAGDVTSASYLKMDLFLRRPKTNSITWASRWTPSDQKRYEAIWKFLTDHETRNPKVLDIDKIVPLPPAKLPPWDGTFQWQRSKTQLRRLRSLRMSSSTRWRKPSISILRPGCRFRDRQTRRHRSSNRKMSRPACRWVQWRAPANLVRKTACGARNSVAVRSEIRNVDF